MKVEHTNERNCKPVKGIVNLERDFKPLKGIANL